jgi:DNA polymerase (family 10)
MPAALGIPKIVPLLIEFSRRTALAGGNPFRAKAYLRAAESLASQVEPIERLIEEDRLQEIPGIGDAIAGIITKLAETGTHSSLEKMRAEIPEGVLEMLAVPGLRPEKVMKLYTELGITTLDELEAAAKADRIREVKGLGLALQRNIIQGLAIRRDAQGARHVHRAEELIAAASASLARSGLPLSKIEPAGDCRRGNELVANLALVAQARELEEGPKTFSNGEFKVYLTDAAHYGSSLLFATGSEAHLAELVEIAGKKGFDLTERGLFKAGKLVSSSSEQKIYTALGLEYVPPELREGRGEIKQARAKKLPRLVELGDIRGILHAHTDASDGVAALEEMAMAVRERGYQYFGVSDHSQTAHYAGGLTIEDIEAQHAEIDRLNARYRGKFRIFKGIESDILPDGSLDYPDEVLARFDFIVASVHGQFRMERAAQTERILRAVANRFVTILGHMTGRQLLRRPGYEVDVEKILAACAKHGVAVEINSNPWRLDLDWRWYQRGLELGCLFSIDPDAHSTSEIDFVRWGVGLARKGGITRDDVLNSLDLNSFSKWLERKRSRSHRGASRARSRGKK